MLAHAWAEANHCAFGSPCAYCTLLPTLSLTHPSALCQPRLTYMQEERTQGRNRERAMALLRAKLFELELEKQRRCGWVGLVMSSSW